MRSFHENYTYFVVDVAVAVGRRLVVLLLLMIFFHYNAVHTKAFVTSRFRQTFIN